MIRKYYIAWLSLIVLSGCGTVKSPSEAWIEKGNHVGETELIPGIAAYGAKDVQYQRGNKTVLNVSLKEPVVIAVASKPEKWGFFQFPNIYRTPEGQLFSQWSVAADAIASYGKGGQSYSISKDGGKTWSAAQREPLKGEGLKLPGGDRIEIHTPPALKAEDVPVPDSIGFSFNSPKAKTNGYTYYRVQDLPKALQGVYINRRRKGESEWITEHNTLDDPQLVRYTRVGLFPVVWWGDMQVAADGSVMAGVYPTHVQDESGKVGPSGISFYRSTDDGRTWKLRARLPYTPDINLDPAGNERLVFGWTEPAFEILANGTYITVLRTNGPMYISRSTDEGKQWSKPTPFTQHGVLPRILELENGVTVLSSGRPGVQLRFSWDGNAETWSDPFEMMPYEGEKEYVSCGYTGLLATGPDRFLFIYSDFKHTNEQGEIRKAIKVREVIVKKP